jgi:hypothetical protein
MTKPSLEQKIAVALGDGQIASADLQKLISETEQALAEAEATARAERKKALDPIASPDFEKAEQLVWSAQLRRERMQSSLSQLCQRLANVETAETRTRWEARHDAAKVKRDALPKEFAELYPKLTAQLCDLFHRASPIDRECSP